MFQCRIHHMHYCDHNSDLQSIQAIPAMQRRRLSGLAKLALHAAQLAKQQYNQPIDYIVWSSHYGDEKNTLNILMDIAENQSPSPTQFSTSVHNAIAGLYSILFQDPTPSTSMSSAAHHSWQDALFEAYAYLKSNHQQSALLIYYDEPLPQVYNQDYAVVSQAYAIATVISLVQPNLLLQPADQITDHQVESVQAFYQFWQGQAMNWQHQGWIYQKC
ncbi:beta-ketoacyl synthase chain length factor [Acinetobacter qingfengensis]|uniref:Beta-ketoacyl synthase-like N-terminal domain-containing protein n=1 Tax=Acinetobacter qingfengensis TaxID=1262585 RepID=A0A1E7R2S4_9GAMM|nr:beta-ketoacyl synthase chain length factor [Acinetobacter qingfengensis]KAA8733848.1 beta-ketoacyl synthase chain length factor [Acinetobacter qingfengensis]OEY93639.1 hypothetical protein BJI46_04135 [Acinetobacter qingfengensis]